MRKRNVGALVAIVLGVILTFGAVALAETLNWDPVTKYTDNTVIGSEAGGIFYNVDMDNTLASGNFSGASWVVPSVQKGSAHTFRVMTVLGNGAKSDWSASLGWTSPLGKPAVPTTLRILP